MSKSNIPQSVKIELAARSGGRCEICGEYLFSDFFHQNVHLEENAHVLPDSDKGPRYKEIIKKAELKGGEIVDNLMFLCPKCHTAIDKSPDFYTVDSLLKIKKEHEETVYQSGELIKNRKYVKAVRFTSYIGENEISIGSQEIKDALFAHSVSYKDTIIDLSTASKKSEGETLYHYYNDLSRQLERNYKDKIINSLNNQDPTTIAIFALAPQPLLIKLGRLFNNTYPIYIFNKTRKANWNPVSRKKLLNYLIVEPEIIRGRRVVLSLEISGATSDSEIGKGDIWRITINNPRFDAVSCKEDIDNFGSIVETFFAKIKEIYGVEKEIDVYLALPQSLAVKFGSVYMPRAYNKLVLYDKDKTSKDEPKFQKALIIS